MRLFDLRHDSGELALLALIDEVLLILPNHRLVGRDRNDFELVDLEEFFGLRCGCTGHAGQLPIKPEVVLQRDRGQGDRLRQYAYVFLRLDCLMQAVR